MTRTIQSDCAFEIYRSIVSDMEEPQANINAVRVLLGEMVDLCGPGEGRAAIYDLLERNIDVELKELCRL